MGASNGLCSAHEAREHLGDSDCEARGSLHVRRSHRAGEAGDVDRCGDFVDAPVRFGEVLSPHGLGPMGKPFGQSQKDGLRRPRRLIP